MGVFARRAFTEGEFIFRRRQRVIDAAGLEDLIAWERVHLCESWSCECGSDACTGVVESSFFELDPPLQELLVPHAGASIRREYRRRRLSP